VALVAAGNSVGGIGAIVAFDRIGKGIRTAPRDAMIAASTPEPELGAAFGVHRALDTAGAMIGPLLAFALLALVPNGYDSVFAVSLCVAIVGLGVIVLFVPGRGGQLRPDEPVPEPPSLRASLGLLRLGRFRALLIAAVALGLVTLSDAFLYLTLQRRTGIAPSFVPLLYVAAAVVYMALAVPVGRVADRVGRARVFLVGYVLLLAVYVGLVLPSGTVPALPLAVAVVLLVGTYYASTDGVEAAFASSVLPAELRGTGLGLFGTAANAAGFLSSVVFGLVWTRWGVDLAVVVFGGGLALAIAVAAAVLAATRPKMVEGAGPVAD
jgi:MFS family permease